MYMCIHVHVHVHVYIHVHIRIYTYNVISRKPLLHIPSGLSYTYMYMYTYMYTCTWEECMYMYMHVAIVTIWIVTSNMETMEYIKYTRMTVIDVQLTWNHNMHTTHVHPLCTCSTVQHPGTWKYMCIAH